MKSTDHFCSAFFVRILPLKSENTNLIFLPRSNSLALYHGSHGILISRILHENNKNNLGIRYNCISVKVFQSEKVAGAAVWCANQSS